MGGQPPAFGENTGLEPAVRPESLQDLRDVPPTSAQRDPEPPRDRLVLEPLGEQDEDALLDGHGDVVRGLRSGREGGGVLPVPCEDVQQVGQQVGLPDDERAAGAGREQRQRPVHDDHLGQHLGQGADLGARADELFRVQPGRLVEAGGVLVEAAHPDAPAEQGQVPGQCLAQRGRWEGAAVLGDQDLAAAGVDDVAEQRADGELVRQVVDGALREGVLTRLEVDGHQRRQAVALLLDASALGAQGLLLGAEGGVAVGQQLRGGGLGAHRLPADGLRTGGPRTGRSAVIGDDGGNGGGNGLEETGLGEGRERPPAVRLADPGLGGAACARVAGVSRPCTTVQR